MSGAKGSNYLWNPKSLLDVSRVLYPGMEVFYRKTTYPAGHPRLFEWRNHSEWPTIVLKVGKTKENGLLIRPKANCPGSLLFWRRHHQESRYLRKPSWLIASQNGSRSFPIQLTPLEQQPRERQPFAAPGWQEPLFLTVSSVAQLCLTLCDPMNNSTPVLPVHHQLPESTQTRVHWVGDAIQPSHPLSSPSPPALNLSQHQGLFNWVSSSHQVAKVLEFHLQHQSFQWTSKTDLL